MNPSTNICEMLAGNQITVPSYQRAYSWETAKDNTKNKHVNIFLLDLEDFIKSETTSTYYFGHFLFEMKGENRFAIIDGQQRLSTITIFTSALFKRLKEIRLLTEEEQYLYNNLIKENNVIRFTTVDYDRILFKDYVINQVRKNKDIIETQSGVRIVSAFDYFQDYLKDKDDIHISSLLRTISKASCSTHIVTNESDAIQMFIFQNNRGKKPSNLEIIKAQFMYHVHLYGGDETEGIIEDIKDRFESIYKSISRIENKINEDDILMHTLRVYFNSLWEDDPIQRIHNLLKAPNSIEFINSFILSLTESFDAINIFLTKDEKDNFDIHSFISIGNFSLVCPFIIKAYKYQLAQKEKGRLCKSLEQLVLRHRLVGTRADMISRINEVFQEFNESNTKVEPIIERINWMKEASDWWWAHWNNDNLMNSLQGKIHHSTAIFILWKYENFLLQQGHSGYSPRRYDSITHPHLEHIAPQTEPNIKKHGYGNYNKDIFKNKIECIGNYLLLSENHNTSIGNSQFVDKLSTYIHLEQQRKLINFVENEDSPKWNEKAIDKRQNEIISFIIAEF